MTDYEKAVGILGAKKMRELNYAGLTVISQSTLNRLKFENEEMTESLNRFDKLRPTVVEFALDMEKKLKENDHKVHWSECNFDYLIKRLQQETTELIDALKIYSAYTIPPDEVVREAADVANFAMMIADNLKDNSCGKGRK